MLKRMLFTLAVVAILLGSLGFVKFRQIQTAIAQGASFQPPPTAVTESAAMPVFCSVALSLVTEPGTVMTAGGPVCAKAGATAAALSTAAITQTSASNSLWRELLKMSLVRLIS